MRLATLAAVALFLAVFVGTTLAALLDEGDSGVDGPRPMSPGLSVTSPAQGSATAPDSTTGTATAAPQPGYPYTEVARHATSSDCWIVVNARVYDVTPYVRTHPGGAETITPWCGRESTVAYETEDGQGTHSSRADRLLDTYYIGDLR